MKAISVTLSTAALFAIAGCLVNTMAQPLRSSEAVQTPLDDASNSSENNLANEIMARRFFLNKFYNSKRNFGMDGSRRGFHADTFTSGFGEFSPMKRRAFFTGANSGPAGSSKMASLRYNAIFDNLLENKRVTGMGGRSFHGDTFTSGFGEFSTM